MTRLHHMHGRFVHMLIFDDTLINVLSSVVLSRILVVMNCNCVNESGPLGGRMLCLTR